MNNKETEKFHLSSRCEDCFGGWDDHAVINALVKINEDELIGYDSIKVKNLLNIILEYIETFFERTSQENHCVLVNYMMYNPDIKVLKSKNF